MDACERKRRIGCSINDPNLWYYLIIIALVITFFSIIVGGKAYLFVFLLVFAFFLILGVVAYIMDRKVDRKITNILFYIICASVLLGSLTLFVYNEKSISFWIFIIGLLFLLLLTFICFKDDCKISVLLIPLYFTLILTPFM